MVVGSGLAGLALDEGNQFDAEERGERERVVPQGGFDGAEQFLSEFVDVVFDETGVK